MEAILILAGLSLVGCVAFAVALAALFDAAADGRPSPAASIAAERSRFFQRGAPPPPPEQPLGVPVQVLLLQIERHVRLEHAAAESFHLRPTPESLHTHTSSPLMH